MGEFIERYAELTKVQRFGIFGLIIAGVILGHYTYIFSAQSDELKAAQSRIKQKERERNKQSTVVEERIRLEAQVKELEERLELVRVQLPDTADIPQLILLVGNSADKVGLKMDKFGSADKKKKGFYEELIFKMEMRGSYHEIGSFIDSLARLERIVNVSNLTMTKPKISEAKVEVNAQFLLKTYRFLAGG